MHSADIHHPPGILFGIDQGHDHPSGDDRVASPMWRRQERYLAAVRES